jgi:hypothetical protein
MPVLTDDQSTVLKVLMVEGATPAERTEAALPDRTGLAHVGRVRSKTTSICHSSQTTSTRR